MTESLRPGQTIGILGGGQLGRMLAMAAARLGLRTHVYEPAANPPAGEVAACLTTASYDDEPALRAFAASVDVVTYEFENVPASALDLIEAQVSIRPNRQALSVSQDRLTEKTFLTDIGLTVAPFAAVKDDAELAQALGPIGMPAILKTLGYMFWMNTFLVLLLQKAMPGQSWKCAVETMCNQHNVTGLVTMSTLGVARMEVVKCQTAC